jgi:DNA polymerase III epsilon subunit-like protein
VLLAVEAADRLVGAIVAGGPLPAREAARVLLAFRGEVPEVADVVLQRVVAEDGRLVAGDEGIGLAAAPWSRLPLEEARYAVVDLETGGVGRNSRIVEAAVVVLEPASSPRELELALGARDEQASAVRELLAFAGDAVLCGHNLPFDLGFLDRELRPTGVRLAAPLLDTLRLSRRLLGDRSDRLGLADLCDLVGTPTRPEHRALPDARATAELLAHLLEIARERGARTVGDVLGLARGRAGTLAREEGPARRRSGSRKGQGAA